MRRRSVFAARAATTLLIGGVTHRTWVSFATATSLAGTGEEVSPSVNVGATQRQTGCCADTSPPPTESHGCHNAHRKPTTCDLPDEAFTKQQLFDFKKLCYAYQEENWYNDMLNCMVRRVVVVSRQAMRRIALGQTNALWQYLDRLADIGFDFNQVEEIPSPLEGKDARNAGVCLHKLWWTMIRAHETVMNVTMAKIVEMGGKDFEGPWGWREGTCSQSMDSPLGSTGFTLSAGKYAQARLKYAESLRLQASFVGKYVSFPNGTASKEEIGKLDGCKGTGSSPTKCALNLHVAKYYVYPFIHFFKMFQQGYETFKEIELTDKMSMHCFHAIVMDVSPPDVMRAVGGLDQFMVVYKPDGQEQKAGLGSRCAEAKDTNKAQRAVHTDIQEREEKRAEELKKTQGNRDATDKKKSEGMFGNMFGSR